MAHWREHRDNRWTCWPCDLIELEIIKDHSSWLAHWNGINAGGSIGTFDTLSSAQHQSLKQVRSIIEKALNDIERNK